jgi:hypothetical protein
MVRQINERQFHLDLESVGYDGRNSLVVSDEESREKSDENEKHLSFIDLITYYCNDKIYISSTETTIPPERQ